MKLKVICGTETTHNGYGGHSRIRCVLLDVCYTVALVATNKRVAKETTPNIYLRDAFPLSTQQLSLCRDALVHQHTHELLFVFNPVLMRVQLCEAL